MNSLYLTEAFKELNLLNEEAFDVDEQGLDDFKELVTSEEDGVIDIIDDEAEDFEEIEDSYVGKVVIDCCVCHSKIYKDADSIVIDEESDLANVGEECPYCYSVDGYKIIGKIAPYEEESEVKVEVEDKDEDGKIEDDEVEVSVEESLKQKRADIVKECKNTKKYGKAIRLKEEDEVDSIEDRIEEVVDNLSDEAIQELTTEMIADYIVDNIDRIENEEVQAVVDEIEAEVPAEEVEVEEEEVVEESKDCDKWKKKAEKPVLEDLEKVELETEDSVIKISEEPKEELPDEEMIAPLDIEAEKEIVDTTNEVESEEEPEDEFVDQDFEEFDEEEFNGLGESYLKKVYDNVKAFKTTKVSTKGNTLKLEGVIRFASGNKKNTTFLFEAKDITKKGRVRFIGENLQISRGKKSFILTGTVKDKKLISESLNYNYRTKDANGKSVRLYGTVKRK